MDYKKKFPNGVTNYLETFYTVVEKITLGLDRLKVVQDRQAAQGHGGLWELAEEVTDNFERKYKDHEWGVHSGGDWFDTLEAFIENELK